MSHARGARADQEIRAIKPAPPHEDWMEDAACKGMPREMFFPEGGESNAPALAVCAVCPVRIDCLNYAQRHCIRFGVWGGVSERARRRDRALAKMKEKRP